MATLAAERSVAAPPETVASRLGLAPVAGGTADLDVQEEAVHYGAGGQVRIGGPCR